MLLAPLFFLTLTCGDWDGGFFLAFAKAFFLLTASRMDPQYKHRDALRSALPPDATMISALSNVNLDTPEPPAGPVPAWGTRAPYTLHHFCHLNL